MNFIALVFIQICYKIPFIFEITKRKTKFNAIKLESLNLLFYNQLRFCYHKS